MSFIENNLARAIYHGYLKNKEATSVGKNNESTRVSWIEQTLKKIPENLNILDAGAGEMQFKKFCNHLNYVSQDFSKYDGSGDSKGLQTKKWETRGIEIVSDIVEIPIDKNSFDAILCTEVLEHVPDPVKVLREFDRILKPGGYLVLTAPFCSLTHFSPYHFSTGFNRYFYQYWMKKLNFEIIELSANGNFFEYLSQEINRVSNTGKEYARKSPTILERHAIEIVNIMLGKMSENDSNSNELLCFGYHLFANKLIDS